ncbi:hypothetical protein HYS31_06360 [Candidatus Woesearchaeota archaeon]|nr:hypothetical protein [Candidatus Woesearchaeota archaeon]
MKKSINEFVWKFIDTDLSIKKDLGRKIVNIRKLAKHILSSQKLDTSLDAVISAIRRYNADISKKEETHSVHSVIKQAKVSIKTKMSSLLLKRTDFVKTKLGRPDKLMDFQGHDIIRVLEGSQALTIVFDQKNFEKIKSAFPKEMILEENKKVGMIEIEYPSIIDALISSNEHILIIDEDKLIKAFDLIYNLCKS